MNDNHQLSVETSAGVFHGVDRGEGPTVLLVHGFPLDHQMWDQQIEALEPGYRVIAADLLGFGNSTSTPRESVSMAEFADELAVMLDALGVTDKIIFCGLSMGGYIGWEFWRRHADRLQALILCDTRAAGDDPATAKGRQMAATQVLQAGSGSMIEAMIPRLFAASSRQSMPDVVAATRARMEQVPAWSIAAAQRGMATRDDFRDQLPSISIPALIVCGDQDEITPAEEMQEIADQLPQASFVEIANAGHMAPLEQPAAVNHALLDFLSSVSP